MGKKGAEIAVVGAGIAGLTAAASLIEQGFNVFLLEKNDRAGGRMKTSYGTQPGETHETGAWRVQGPLAETLIRTLGGTLTPLIPRLLQEASISDATLSQVVCDKLSTNKKISQCKIVKNMSARDIVAITGANEVDVDKGYHGINSRIVGTRAYSTGSGGESIGAIGAGEVGDGHAPYYFCEEGWTFVIDRLVDIIGRNRIRFGCSFLGFDGKKISYLSRNSKKEVSEKVAGCILATPPHTYPSDDHMLRLLAATVESHSLIHVWFKTDRPIPYTDFKSEGILSQVIANPMQPSSIAQVYACDHNALTWLHLYQNSRKACLAFLNQKLQEHGFPFRATEILDVNFWEHAVHTWRAVTSFTSASTSTAKAIQPDPINRPTLFTCGEALSTDQGWADGALSTAAKAAANLGELIRSGGTNTAGTIKGATSNTSNGRAGKNRMKYNGYVVKIPQQWFRNHPGGAEALRNHQNEDVTVLWRVLHGSSSIAHATLWHMLVMKD